MWNTLTDVRKVWKDAPADDFTLTLFLESAHSACLAYVPLTVADPDVIDGGSFEDEEPVSASWKLAEIMQARNIWNSTKASPGGDFDGSGYSISTHPLDWQVKQLLRPQRGLGAIA